jgi:hypothetical protein
MAAITVGTTRIPGRQSAAGGMGTPGTPPPPSGVGTPGMPPVAAGMGTPGTPPPNHEAAAPIDLPTPKRGAFPTPNEEIERATPYVPESDQAGDQPATESVSPTNAGQKDKKRGTKAPEPK